MRIREQLWNTKIILRTPEFPGNRRCKWRYFFFCNFKSPDIEVKFTGFWTQLVSFGQCAPATMACLKTPNSSLSVNLLKLEYSLCKGLFCYGQWVGPRNQSMPLFFVHGRPMGFGTLIIGSGFGKNRSLEVLLELPCWKWQNVNTLVKLQFVAVGSLGNLALALRPRARS